METELRSPEPLREHLNTGKSSGFGVLNLDMEIVQRTYLLTENWQNSWHTQWISMQTLKTMQSPLVYSEYQNGTKGIFLS